MVDVDMSFLESLKGIMNGCQDAASTVGTNNDLNAERRLKLNEELRKFPTLVSKHRIMIGTELIADPVKLEFFFNLPDDDREEFVNIQVEKLMEKERPS